MPPSGNELMSDGYIIYNQNEIFLNVPPHQVVRACRLVCHEWKEVADRDSFWRERCRREGYHFCHASKVPTNWKHFYFACKNRRNLLRNPRGEDEFNGWTIVENGGDHWKIEAPMVSHPNEGVQKNFVTSFGMCLKSQLIDLKEEGYNSSFMDEIQPHIRISDCWRNYARLGNPGLMLVHSRYTFLMDRRFTESPWKRVERKKSAILQ
uniref:FBA domain-containing protein n=1 Tax=Oryzias sinensis TaxID=183150 RepID=A0A8C7YQV3_9TELE